MAATPPNTRPKPAVQQRRAEVLRLRTMGYKHREIAEQLGISTNLVGVDYHRGMQELANHVTVQREAAKLKELLKLDTMEERMWTIMRKTHLKVDHGHVVTVVNDWGEEVSLQDDKPAMDACDRLLRIAERRARLLGLDEPIRTKHEITDEQDREIESLLQLLANVPRSQLPPTADLVNAVT